MAGTYNDLWKKAWKETTETGPSCRTRFRIMLRLFRKHGLSGSILDVGCGDGNFLSRLAEQKKGFELYGFDISDEAIRLAKRKKFISDLFVGDLLKKETLPRKRFDVVVCSEVLEHIDDYKKALKNISGLVKRDGKLIVTVPHSMRYWTEHDRYAMHFRRFEKKELDRDIKNLGFSVLESFAWGSFLYNIYYFFLEKAGPKRVMEEKPGMIKKILSAVIYHVLKIDDLFAGENGRRLFILAEKK